MKGRATSRQLRAAETKRRIYESAVELMRVHGIDNFSVDDIVEAAGVSKGAFYVHYKSKYSLIADYVSTVDINYEDYFKSIPPDIKQSEMLLLVTEKIADVLANDIGFDVMRTVYEALIKKTDGTEALLSYNRRLYQIYRQIVTQGVRQGEFREALNIDSVSNHCIMSIRGMTFEWCVRYPDFDLKKEVLQHFDILLAGIKNR
ncbi:MAG: TetR/AcrR family transcriptional regulator [Bacillota bacterium]